jgi:hypothetical protein
LLNKLNAESSKYQENEEGYGDRENGEVDAEGDPVADLVSGLFASATHTCALLLLPRTPKQIHYEHCMAI